MNLPGGQTPFSGGDVWYLWRMVTISKWYYSESDRENGIWSSTFAMAQHITHRWPYVMLGAIAPLSNTGHNYPYSCGYMLSIVLHTMSMVLYVVSLHVRICCMKVLVTAAFRMRSIIEVGRGPPWAETTVGWGAQDGDKSTTRLSDQEHWIVYGGKRYHYPNNT